jgi:endoglucanase
MGFLSTAPLGRHTKRIAAKGLLAASLAILLGGSTGAQSSGRRLYVNPDSTVVRAAKGLTGQAEQDARLIAQFPSATWLTNGTPEEVQAQARKLVSDAAKTGTIPVLVAYNVPARDCSLYSAGGAADSAAYAAWIRGLAAGVGEGRAIIILEPDGLGVIPWNTTLTGQQEIAGRPTCMPALPKNAIANCAMLLGCSRLCREPSSTWTAGQQLAASGEIAARLLRANIGKARGFFLNVSNYESDARLKRYAHWVSDCIALVSQRGLNPRECPGFPITGARDYPGPGRMSMPLTIGCSGACTSHETRRHRNTRCWTPVAMAAADGFRSPVAIAMPRCGVIHQGAGLAAGLRWPATIRTSTRSFGSRSRANPMANAIAVRAGQPIPNARWWRQPREDGLPRRRAN